MDASTYTAYVLERQRAADLAREHALRVSHRERRAAVGEVPPARGRGIRSLFARRGHETSCEQSSLALAGPAS
jgi:hypothetical protein